MATIDLLSIEPHKVSRNLKGYSVLFFGEPKTGKTTIASKFPKNLIIAAERGYLALPGVMAQDVNSWADFKKVLKQLENPAVKEKFETICLDTVDILYQHCSKYIAKKYGEDDVEDVAYGRGFSKTQQEFDQCLRAIVMMGYGLVMISHAQQKTYKDENDKEYSKIEPTLDKRGMLVCSRMVDIIGYAKPYQLENGGVSTKLYLRGTPRYVAGSRFKYLPFEIEFNYESLVNAIADAIEKQEKEEGSSYFTDELNAVDYEDTKYDFDEIMQEIKDTINTLMERNKEYYAPRVTEIIEREFGKGKKISEASRDQVEQSAVVLENLKDLVKENPQPNTEME